MFFSDPGQLIPLFDFLTNKVTMRDGLDDGYLIMKSLPALMFWNFLIM